jgi:hypothetical protein
MLAPVAEPGMLNFARKAMFALLDRRGLPVGCGFFVTETGIALTINHDYDKWSVADRAGNMRVVEGCKVDGSGQEALLKFKVVVTNKTFDFTVLELLSAYPQRPTSFFPLPTGDLPDDALWGKSAAVLHANIALNRQFDQHPNSSVALCNISTVHADMLLYTAATSAGDSGGALLLLGKHLVGMHREGMNDQVVSPSGGRHYKTPSEASSPSTSASALRLDIAVVRDAVAAADAAVRSRLVAAAVGGGM